MSYNPAIPGANQLLSQSQGDIQTNFSQISTWTAIDHVGITTGVNSGQHSQVSLPANGMAGSPAGLASTIYSSPGTADATKSQLYFKNSWGNIPISFVKAFGLFDITGTLNNGFNLQNLVSWVAGVYTLNMITALPTSAYLVFAFTKFQSATGAFINYDIITASQFTLTHANTSTQSPFAVMVLQI